LLRYYKHNIFKFSIYSISQYENNINSLCNFVLNIYRLYSGIFESMLGNHFNAVCLMKNDSPVKKGTVQIMSDFAKILGQRIRNYRTSKGLSQEKLAELSGFHPTYIGQVERGEKNATVDSVQKISAALGISLSKLFEKLGAQETEARNIPLECYEFLSAKTKEEQEHIYTILLEIDKYKNK